MKTSEHLKLSLTELEADKQMDFRTWLSIFAGGGNNNLQKIDNFAKETDNIINVIKESPSTIYVNARKETLGIYIANVLSIAPEVADLTLNGIYIIKLDIANETSVVSVRINDLIGVSLKKTNIEGVIVDLDINDIQAEQEHIFRYNGQFLILINTDALTFMNKKITDFILKDEIVDNLESEMANVPLSASMGKILNTNTQANVTNLNEHANNFNNSHKVTKGQIGLPLVDNTSDASKKVLSATKLTTARSINGVPFDGTSDISVLDSTKIPSSKIGAINGVVPLDSTKKISSQYLPSYVDDILEAALYSQLPAKGEAGKIYVIYGDSEKLNGQYRWAGTVYSLISNPLDYATSQEALSGVNSTKVMTPLTTNTVAATKVDKVTGKQLSTNDYTTAEKTKLENTSGTSIVEHKHEQHGGYMKYANGLLICYKRVTFEGNIVISSSGIYRSLIILNQLQQSTPTIR